MRRRDGVKNTTPICYDREGSETALLMAFRKMRLIEEGSRVSELMLR
jgi:hypothetical protein